jgi:hypothetical protein
MPADNLQTKLTVTIKNTEPIALKDISDMFNALEQEYKRFVSINDPRNRRKARLYLNDVRHGSQEFDLVAIVPLILAGIENFNSLYDFADHLQKLFKKFKSDDSKVLPEKITTEDIDITAEKNISKILRPVVKDQGSQMNLSATYQENHIHIHLTSQEAENIQRNLSVNARRIESTYTERIGNTLENTLLLDSPKVLGFEDSKVVFYWFKEEGSNDLNSGIIESIYPRNLRVEFESEDIEQQIRNVKGNPFDFAFIVDVRVETFKSRPIMYKIVRLHDIINTEH